MYKHVNGSLRYLYNTRPIICHNTGFVSRFFEKTRLCHLFEANRILRYIRGTNDNGVLMPNQQSTKMEVKVYIYFDSDWSGDQDNRKRTTGYLFMIGLAPFSWILNKQVNVYLSSC